MSLRSSTCRDTALPCPRIYGKESIGVGIVKDTGTRKPLDTGTRGYLRQNRKISIRNQTDINTGQGCQQFVITGNQGIAITARNT